MDILRATEDNKLRPFTTGLKPQDYSIATILVYNKTDEKEKTETIDYLSNLESNIQSLTQATISRPGGSQAISEGTPSDPSGSIVTTSLDGKNEYYGVFNNFSLLSVQESSDQIVKLHVNFGADWNAFFFGDKPKVYSFSGFFLDSADYPFYQEFMVAYEKYLSGRKSVENKLEIKFLYDGKIVDGYILSINTTQSSQDENTKSFQFNVLVKGLSWARMNIIAQKNSTNNKVINLESFNGLSNSYRLGNSRQTDMAGNFQESDIRTS